MVEEQSGEVIYGGEPPLKKTSDKMIAVGKKMIKIPTPLSMKDELPDEELVKVVQKLCARVNKLETDKIGLNNRITRLNKSFEKLPGVTKTFIQCDKFDDLVDAQETIPDGVPIMSEKEYLMESDKIIRFEDVAPEELVKERDETKDRKNKELQAKIHNEEYRARDRKAKEDEERIMSLSEEDTGQIIIPTDQEIADSTRVRWLGVGMAIREASDYNRCKKTEGVGSKPPSKDLNMFQDFERTSVVDPKQGKEDKQFRQDNVSDWKKRRMFMPFMDPSNDYLQSNLTNVYVKDLGSRGKIKWVDYYEYYVHIMKEYMIVFRQVENDEEKLKELGLDGGHNVILNIVDDVMAQFNVRPSSKAHLLRACKRLDQTLNHMIYFIKTVRPDKKIRELEDKEIIERERFLELLAKSDRDEEARLIREEFEKALATRIANNPDNKIEISQ
ncbi:hypothetical protein EDC05_006486 [Coemansia umbellata]|nr:hypothetical protein EDC05_006486 [Coemansia umbellata]